AAPPPVATRGWKPTRPLAAPERVPAARFAPPGLRRATLQPPPPPARRPSSASTAEPAVHSADPSTPRSAIDQGHNPAIDSFSNQTRTYLSALGPGNHGQLDRANPGLLAVQS